MNQRQKEILQAQLNSEKAVLKQLEANYKDALDEINSKIELLMARQDADMQHVIYQVEYQKALKTQIQAILETLQANEFDTLSQYLTQSYEDGFIGTMYDLQGQGIPLIFPIDQQQVVDAIQNDTKLSTNLYTSLGHDMTELKKRITGEISRGLSSGQMYNEIARNVSNWARIPKNNAMRIARTEAHRIQCKATYDAQHKAKDKGADVVKQWDASLDGSTRKSHRKLDGQIRELDEPFEVNGHKAMYPSGFGRPEEDINCRCAILQRARWALGNDYTKWSEDEPIVYSDDGTTQFAIIEAKNYKDFQEKYKKASERVRSNVQKINSEYTVEKTGKGAKIKATNSSKETKAVKVADLSKEMQDTIKSYTRSNYDEINEYTQYISTDSGSPSISSTSRKAWEEDILPNISEETKKQAEELLDVIKNQPTSTQPVVRLERGKHTLKVGDTVTFGVKSASADVDFVNKVLEGEVEGFGDDIQSLARRYKGSTEYVFSNHKGLNIESLSEFPDQKEILIAGEYEVEKVEEIPNIEGGWKRTTISIKDKFEKDGIKVEKFTSKNGNEMVRYMEDGKEKTMKLEKYETGTIEESEYIEGQLGRTKVYLKLKNN